MKWGGHQRRRGSGTLPPGTGTATSAKERRACEVTRMTLGVLCGSRTLQLRQTDVRGWVMAERLPETSEDEQEPEDDGGLPGALMRALENVGLRGSRLHERAEQLY